MAALIAAFALAAMAQPASRPWICARNFAVGAHQGLASQTIDPDGRLSSVAVEIWERGGARLYWNIPAGTGVARPRYFSWEMEIPPPSETLWTRYWGDGRYLGQALLLDVRRLRRLRRHSRWSVATASPEILEGMMAAEQREVEIVNQSGARIARATVPLPPGSALRDAIENEMRWLESVIRTRSEPCYEQPDDESEI